MPAEPLERLRQDLVADLGDGLLLLETHAAHDGRTTVLVVVGRLVDAAQARVQAEAALRRHVESVGEPAHLELLDQATFDAVQRLVEAGVVQLAPAGRRLLHRSPALADLEAVNEQRRRHRARQYFTRGEHKQRMATLLAEGGFPAEALPPLAEAVQAALLCLAHLAGVTTGDGGEELSSTAIDSLRHAAPPVGDLAAETLPLSARLQERAAAFATVPEEEARAWVQEGASLLAQIEDSFSREPLGMAAAR